MVALSCPKLNVMVQKPCGLIYMLPCPYIYVTVVLLCVLRYVHGRMSLYWYLHFRVLFWLSYYV